MAAAATRAAQVTPAAKSATIRERLAAHLDGDGTPNDLTTNDLYREAHGLPEDAETDLEEVERWAFDLVNAEGC